MPVEGVSASPLPSLNTPTASPRITPTNSTHLMEKSNSSQSNGVDSLTAAFWKQANLSNKEQSSPKLLASTRRISSNGNLTDPKNMDLQRSKATQNIQVANDNVSSTSDRTNAFAKEVYGTESNHSGMVNDASSMHTSEVGRLESSAPSHFCSTNSSRPCASNSTCATDQFQLPTNNGVKLKRHSAGNGKIKPSPPATAAISLSRAKPISAIELMTKLENEKRTKLDRTMLLIDMRDISEYNNCTITGSINVNLPTLLIKRFKRNAMSTFKMENFVTSTEGKEYFSHKDKYNVPIVVFDQSMDESDVDLHAWTLLAILEKIGLDDSGAPDTASQKADLFWLKGGYEVFKRFDVNGDLRTNPGAFMKNSNSSPTLNVKTVDGITLDATLLSRPAPMLSRSTTIPSSAPMNQSANLQRRASLFSLDTGAARARRENSNRILRQASQRAASRAAANGASQPESLTTSPESRNDHAVDGRKDEQQQHDLEVECDSVRHPTRQWSGRSKNGSMDGLDSATTNDSGFYTSSSVNSASEPTQTSHLPPYINEWTEPEIDDEVDEIMSSDSPPVSCEETQFVVSEIVPGFLFVGPEITSTDHVQLLQEKSVKRILNMAEECDDDVPGLRESFIYKKIPARDTVDMRNVSSTFNIAVKFIGKSLTLQVPDIHTSVIC